MDGDIYYDIFSSYSNILDIEIRDSEFGGGRDEQTFSELIDTSQQLAGLINLLKSNNPPTQSELEEFIMFESIYDDEVSMDIRTVSRFYCYLNITFMKGEEYELTANEYCD